jgi:hypothetical protein
VADHQQCIHCENTVVSIDYGDKKPLGRADTTMNKFRHQKPYENPICSVSPLTDDDVIWVNDDD